MKMLRSRLGAAIPIATILVLAIVGFGSWWLVKNSDLGGAFAIGDTANGRQEVQTIQISGQDCLQVEDTTVTLSSMDALSGASVGSGTTHRYRVDGSWVALSEGGTLTASPGDKLQVVWANVTAPPIAFTYYPKYETFTVPCRGTVTYTGKLCNNGSDFSLRVFNEEGNLIDGFGGATAENETLAAGDVTTISGDLAAGYQDCHPEGVVIAEYNSSNVDNVIVSFDGIGSQKTATPAFYTVAYASHTTKAYKMPATSSTKKMPFTVTIDVDDTVNPGSEVGQDVLLNFCSGAVYFDDDDNVNAKFGVEDEDSSRTGHCQTGRLNLD